ncbi:MHYT domain-containing protein [Pelagimonas varians]|uniref:CO-responsive transcriptional regulator RcoM n=1 Tax=Pelagimonas varians TaxID=696760 RepID=A0A238L1N6_9RHOB|nr:MHYT domain-containing protein [Pelagimonas varians]PYG27204.1 NO-binding membrane sensor protein with MHYT domain [Pelagimonas varians]SMX48731.1 CO-responsive transcriptional regulator RcoM [Pelagimonas varians]
MQILDFTHNPMLVFASLLVAMMAGFTGLSLTKGLSDRPIAQRKILIVLASIALGGGIWSMHFVAMLGLQLPILFYYDAAITLISALVAILVVGCALLILHFWKRTRGTLVLSGVIVGLGVVAMHYLGMSAMELCQALYTPAGITLAIIASCGLNVAAFAIAYGKRSQRNIIVGTLFFGFAVFAVHFVAIGGTSFVAVDVRSEVGPLISNEVMAIGVVLSSFVLCGAFLLTGVTVLAPSGKPPAPVPVPAPEQPPAPLAPHGAQQIPYEHEGRTAFIDSGAVVAIRAEGHYTYLYTATDKLFCVWSISEAEKRLAPGPFIRTHRSYLINPSHVSGFKRLKDNGVCHFETTNLAKVPVSRSRLKDVRDALGV